MRTQLSCSLRFVLRASSASASHVSKIQLEISKLAQSLHARRFWKRYARHGVGFQASPRPAALAQQICHSLSSMLLVSTHLPISSATWTDLRAQLSAAQALSHTAAAVCRLLACRDASILITACCYTAFMCHCAG